MRVRPRALAAPWLTWCALLAFLATPLAGVVEHCAHQEGDAAPAAAKHAHAGHQGHAPSPVEDSGAPAECPHCPPAQCANHASCGQPGADLLLATGLGGAVDLPVAPVVSPPGVDGVESARPPTPPPQHRA